MKILQSHDHVFKYLGALNGVLARILIWFNEFSRLKKQVTAKNHRRKFKETPKTTIYTSLLKYYTKGTVYSSVKVKAVTSGQVKGWATIRPKNNALLSCICIVENRVHSRNSGLLHTVPY